MLDVETLPEHHIRCLQRTDPVARGSMWRNATPSHKRVRWLALTEAGHALLEEVTPSVPRARRRMLEAPSATDRVESMRVLQIPVSTGSGPSRAPSDARDNRAPP